MKQSTLAPACYPPRAAVHESYKWNDAAYMPPEFEAGVLHQAKKPVWADELHIYDQMQVGERVCYDSAMERSTVLLSCHFDTVTQRFKNPKGKTGIRGRGELGRWGPNHAADVIVTRTTSDGVHMALLCTKNVGDGKSALCWPAGMVEPGHTVPQTLRLELMQEAVKDSDVVEKLFAECDTGTVYAGHVDDWRNTDDAWMETVAQHFHASEEIATQLQLCVSDTEEIKKVAWYPMDQVTAMYASHLDWLRIVLAKLKGDATAEVEEATLDSSPPMKKMKTGDGTDAIDAQVASAAAEVSVAEAATPLEFATKVSPAQSEVLVVT